jgi:hypothetical protein
MERSIGIAIGDNSIEAAWADAVARPVSAPARIVVGGAEFTDFTDRVGDPVPLIGTDGTARLGADLVAVALARLSAGTDRMIVAHPAAWGAYQAGVLRSALTCTDAQGRRLSLVSRPTAALAGAGWREDAAIVVDVDRRGTEISLVQRGRVVRTRTTELFGTEAVDRALAGHAMTALEQPLDREARRELLAGCARARDELAQRPDATIVVRLRTAVVRLRIVRDEFEALIGDAVAGLVADVARMSRESDLSAPPILLVGALARTPLLVELLGARVPGQVVVPADPEWTITRGALTSSPDPRPAPTDVESASEPTRATAPAARPTDTATPASAARPTGTSVAAAVPTGTSVAAAVPTGAAAAPRAGTPRPTGRVAPPRATAPAARVAPPRATAPAIGLASTRSAAATTRRPPAGDGFPGGAVPACSGAGGRPVAAIRGGSRVRTAVVALAAGFAVLIGGAAVSGIGGHGGGSSIGMSSHGHH